MVNQITSFLPEHRMIMEAKNELHDKILSWLLPNFASFQQLLSAKQQPLCLAKIKHKPLSTNSLQLLRINLSKLNFLYCWNNIFKQQKISIKTPNQIKGNLIWLQVSFFIFKTKVAYLYIIEIIYSHQ